MLFWHRSTVSNRLFDRLPCRTASAPSRCPPPSASTRWRDSWAFRPSWSRGPSPRYAGFAEDALLEDREVITVLGALEPVRDELYPGRADADPPAADRADRRRARRHLCHAACCWDSRPHRGAGGPGGGRPGRLRTRIGGCRVRTERAALELDTLTIRIPMWFQRRGGRKLIMTPPGAVPPRSRAAMRRWSRLLSERIAGAAGSRTDVRSRSLTVRSRRASPTAYVCRLLPLTCLAPDIVEALLDGRQPKGLRLAVLLGNAAFAWDGQRHTRGLVYISPRAGNSSTAGRRSLRRT